MSLDAKMEVKRIGGHNYDEYYCLYKICSTHMF